MRSSNPFWHIVCDTSTDNARNRDEGGEKQLVEWDLIGKDLCISDFVHHFNQLNF